MSLRDTYAMFCYGVLVDNEDIAQQLINSYPNLWLDQQGVENVLQNDNPNTTVVFVTGSDKTVGSRTGTFVDTFSVSNSPQQNISVSVMNETLTLSWLLVMWAPGI